MSVGHEPQRADRGHLAHSKAGAFPSGEVFEPLIASVGPVDVQVAMPVGSAPKPSSRHLPRMPPTVEAPREFVDSVRLLSIMLEGEGYASDVSVAASARAAARYGAEALFLDAATSAGVPDATTVPPLSPAPGPRSMT